MRLGDQEVLFCSSKSLQQIDDACVDFIMTSPPYWNLKYYGSEDEIGRGTYTNYVDELNTVWAECFRVAAEHCVMVVNVGHRRHQKRYYPIAFDIAAHMPDWELWDVNIWHIPNALPQPQHYMNSVLDNKHEYLLVFRKNGSVPYTFNKARLKQKYAAADPRKSKMNPLGRCLGSVLRLAAYRPPNIKQKGWHQAAYPEELVAFYVHTYTNPGDLVLDPFLGSGTTLKVAGAMERRGIGVEANAENEDLIRKRMEEPFEMPDWRALDAIDPLSRRQGPRRKPPDQASLDGVSDLDRNCPHRMPNMAPNAIASMM